MKIQDIDNFTRHYLIAALWSSTDENGSPMDKEHSLSDFAPSAVKQAYDECAAFQRDAEPLLVDAYDSDEYAALKDHPDCDGQLSSLAGHDFWFSRCGHGAGFFDRGNARFWNGLQSMARDSGCRDIYAGDDDELYFA